MNSCTKRGRAKRASCGWLILLVVLTLVFRASFAAPASQMSELQTVFIIVMENNAWSAIKGNTNAPYLNNTLLPLASYCENYQNVPGVHPSLPNYLWLESGTNFGITDDGDPSINHQPSINHLVTFLQNSGVSWKAYQEDIDGTTVPLTSMNGYAPRHNPFVYFDDVTGTNNPYWPYGIAHIRPYTEFSADLTNNTVARYNFITPNICNDMHDDCRPLFNGIQQGDNWLSNEVPKILASQAYNHKGALFITWDESYDTDTRVGMIVLSPLARGGGYTNTIYYTHSSMLRTLQEVFGVGPFLGDAANASSLRDLFLTSNDAPATFKISNIRAVGSDIIMLTVNGIITNTPLVLQGSSNLTTWTSLSTNLNPPSTVSIYVTNAVPGLSSGFYRFGQRIP